MDSIKKIMDNPIARKAFIGLGLFLIVIIIIIVAVSCTGGKKYTYQEFEDKIVTLTKNYYDNNKDKLPQNDGDQVTLPIQTFVNNKKIGELSKIIKGSTACRGDVRIINNNNYYLYLPELDCGKDYKYQTLYDVLTSEKNIVASGNGLYVNGNEYTYKGETANNYLLIGETTYRIIKIYEDGTIKIVNATKQQTSSSWDDRYNIEKQNYDGINDFIVNDINSRLKDALDTAYNNEKINDDLRAHFVSKPLCTGKANINNTTFDGSIECATSTEKTPFGVIQANEFVNASLDENCTSYNSSSCLNYNYMTSIAPTWTLTADSDTTYKAYRLTTNGLVISKTSISTQLKIVTALNKETLYLSGTGTEIDPYVIK